VARTAPGWPWGLDECGEAAEEGRNLEVHHRDAEERVLAKRALPRGSFQVSIGQAMTLTFTSSTRPPPTGWLSP
jgi:hypothetical protein